MLIVNFKGLSNISSSTAYQEQKVEVEVFLYKFSQRQRKVRKKFITNTTDKHVSWMLPTIAEALPLLI